MSSCSDRPHDASLVPAIHGDVGLLRDYLARLDLPRRDVYDAHVALDTFLRIVRGQPTCSAPLPPCAQVRKYGPW